MKIFSFRRQSNSSFKKQLLLFFVVSVVIIAVVASYTTAWRTSQIVKQSTLKTGLQLTTNFADQSLLALVTGSKENSKDSMANLLSFQSISGAAIVNPNGVLLSDSLDSSNSNIYHQFIAQLKRGESFATASLLAESENTWLFGAPVYYSEDIDDFENVELEQDTTQARIIGYVVVEYDKEELFQIQSSIFKNNMVIGGVLAALLALFMNWGIKRVTRPLIELSDTMKLTRSVKFYPRAQVSGAKEIRQMAESYNSMMEAIEAQNNELETHRDTLESEVEMRTRELQIARDSALSASRHKSEFLANISHELRTPLQAIIGYTDLVKEDLELESMDEQVDDLNKSIRSAHNLLGLINNILDIAKIEAGKMDLYLKNIDMDDLIDETMETIMPIAIANKNEVKVIKETMSEKLVFDRQKLMQIFLNLLSNACKFTSNGSITFTIKNDESFLYFSIRDTGIGIPASELDLIFNKFTQVDGSQTRRFEGTGLGMAITQNFCELMSGQIEVESELGQGSLFSVRLPINSLK